MVLYRISLVTLVEELQAADPGLINPFYMDDAAFDGSARQSAHVLKLLLERWLDQGYFPNPENSLFIENLLNREEAEKQ